MQGRNTVARDVQKLSIWNSRLSFFFVFDVEVIITEYAETRIRQRLTKSDALRNLSIVEVKDGFAEPKLNWVKRRTSATHEPNLINLAYVKYVEYSQICITWSPLGNCQLTA